MCRIASSVLIFAFSFGAYSEAVDATNCPRQIEDAATGSAMLQVRQATSTVSTKACSKERAMQVPLTEADFAEIAKSCCFEDIEAFIGRLVDEMGLKICDAAGLHSLSPMYSCPSTPVTLAGLKEDLNQATEHFGGINSKCHWLATRYEECTQRSLECAISVERPAPAPRPVASGYLTFRVDNPAIMVRSDKAIDIIRNEMSLSLGIEHEFINVMLASGPLNSEEVVKSLFTVPPSQGFFTIQGETKQCKVFATYSIQEKAPKERHLTTPPPQLNEEDVINKLRSMDTITLERRLTQDIEVIDGKTAGEVECVEFSICEKTSGKCTHQVVKEIPA